MLMVESRLLMVVGISVISSVIRNISGRLLLVNRVNGLRVIIISRKIRVRLISRMFSVILLGVFCCLVFFIRVIIWFRVDLFGLVLICISSQLDIIWVLLVIVEWLLLDLWIIGVDLLVMVVLLIVVMFLMILLLLGIILLVWICIMLFLCRLLVVMFLKLLLVCCLLVERFWLLVLRLFVWVLLCFLVSVLVKLVKSMVNYSQRVICSVIEVGIVWLGMKYSKVVSMVVSLIISIIGECSNWCGLSLMKVCSSVGCYKVVRLVDVLW